MAAALAAGIAAALLYPLPPDAPAPGSDPNSPLVVAFDGDAVLFDSASEAIYQRDGLQAFCRHEQENAAVPLGRGPFAGVLQGLAALQAAAAPGETLVRTCLITARGAPAHARLFTTFAAWGLQVDQMFLMGGAPKAAVLAAIRPHLFFDDSLAHVGPASRIVPTGHVAIGACGDLDDRPSADAVAA